MAPNHRPCGESGQPPRRRADCEEDAPVLYPFFRQQTSNEPVNAHLRCRGQGPTVAKPLGVSTRSSCGTARRYASTATIWAASEATASSSSAGTKWWQEPLLGPFRGRERVCQRVEVSPFDLADRVRNIFPQLVVIRYQLHLSCCC